MSNNEIKNINIENGRIMFRNFSGKEGKYNPAGRRNFCVCIDPSSADALRAEGWNIKTLAPRDEEEEPIPYLQVRVNYDNIPPKIYMVTKKKKTLMNADTIAALDYAQIISCDMTIRPYVWDTENNKVTAYVQTMYVTIEEDEFASTYDFDDSDDE